MISHSLIAIGIMLACWRLGLSLGAPTRAAIWLGWVAGACTCVMREITQREYQWIEAEGGGLRANMPVLEGLKVWDWNAHSIGQTLVALFLSAVLAWLIDRYR